MNILITGAAGFIGHALTKVLLAEGHTVTGIDNMNDYYDVGLKQARLADIGTVAGYCFHRLDLSDREAMEDLFASAHFDVVVNLGGQAGVRYSIANPHAYVESNVVGFLHVLEGCRRHGVRHLVYASSSSVYGQNSKVPYAESDMTDTPVSLYAATKKSNELMAHAYTQLYGLRATGLRFFTVYGPWGRPDMAPFLFMKAMLEGAPIKVFNGGELSRDFTYIDDIVEGVRRVIDGADDVVRHEVYNIGNQSPVALMEFIGTMERVTGCRAIKEMLPMQPGDVHCTYADVAKLHAATGYRPTTNIEEGLRRTFQWYKTFYKI